ncbi:MAG: O-methyltransferase [Bacilli bacterium]|nr:O-methyltransferase [Bacilli bacterium]
MYNDVIKEMEKYAEENSVPIMQKRSMTFLCKFIKKNNIKRILEIGTAIGYSAINMALVDENIEIVSIERDQDKYIEAIKNIKKCNLDKRISLILGDALNLELEGKYDMIFIDAAKGQYLNFFNKYKENLVDDGFVISDNIEFHGHVENYDKIENRNLRQLVGKLIKYIEFLKENDEYETKFYKVGDGLAITYKKGEVDE